MRNFRELEVWKDSLQIVKLVYELTDLLPMDEKFGLISQMRRSVISIPSNIAEGSSKESQKDFVRFLQISLGSAFELETQLEICVVLNFSDPEKINELQNEIVILQRRINSLINYAKTQ